MKESKRQILNQQTKKKKVKKARQIKLLDYKEEREIIQIHHKNRRIQAKLHNFQKQNFLNNN